MPPSDHKSLDQDWDLPRFTESLDLDQELVDFSFFLDWHFSICQDFWAWSPSKSLDNVEISL
jgi:hypothetical protein